MEYDPVIQTFMQSNAWDKRFNLPLVPDHSNPWIYGAYALKLMKDSKANTKVLENSFFFFSEKCRVELGLYNRWPDNLGGKFSFDEIIGICYAVPQIAKDILMYLDFNDGRYNNEKDMTKHPDTFNMYRFPFLRPFVAISAGAVVNVMSELKWCGYVLLNAYKAEKGNCDTKLMIWLMAERMTKKPLCWIAYHIWKLRMKAKGMTISYMFEEHLKNFPVYKETAIACYET